MGKYLKTQKIKNKLLKIENAQQLPRHISNPTKFQYRYPVKGIVESRFKNGVMINCDYKSLEIFVAGMVSHDKAMTQILLDGADYHTMTARNMWHIPDNEPVPGDVRSHAKAASFGRS